VKPAGTLNDVHAGAQVQVIGVAQDYLSLYVVAQLAHVHSLNATHRAHWHEDGCLNVAVPGAYQSRASLAVAICCYYFVVHIQWFIRFLTGKITTTMMNRKKNQHFLWFFSLVTLVAVRSTGTVNCNDVEKFSVIKVCNSEILFTFARSKRITNSH
jgi:hypothetical protein